MALAIYAYYEDFYAGWDTTPAPIQNTEKSRRIVQQYGGSA
jgi:hypothetical protein